MCVRLCYFSKQKSLEWAVMTAQVLLLMMIQLFAGKHRLGATQSTLGVSHSSQNQHSVSLAGSGTKMSSHCLHGRITEALAGWCHCD